MIVSPDDPVPGENPLFRVEPDRAKEIMANNFLASVDYYQLILSQDVIDAASDLQLGKINKENLEGAKKDLKVLKDFLIRFRQKPQDFVLRERRETRDYDDERHLTLILPVRRKERFLPEQKEKAVNELVIDLRLPIPSQESLESLTIAKSLRRSKEPLRPI
jgi:hypothetical protein